MTSKLDDRRSRKTKEAFIDYITTHPDERFWQAIRNFSGYSFVYVSKKLLEGEDLEDTFYWEEI